MHASIVWKELLFRSEVYLWVFSPFSYTNQTKHARRQSRTQSPQAVWLAVVRQKRLWRLRILLPQDFCGKKMKVVTKQPIKKIYFLISPESPLATNRWTLCTRLAYRLKYIFARLKPHTSMTVGVPPVVYWWKLETREETCTFGFSFVVCFVFVLFFFFCFFVFLVFLLSINVALPPMIISSQATKYLCLQDNISIDM